MNSTISIPRLLPLLLVPFSAMAGLSSVAIVNPSFQTDTFPSEPGYLGGANPGTLTGWSHTGGVGAMGPNGSQYHFSDGTTVDGGRLAFIQGGGSLTQTIGGLVPGERYVFQGWFRGRNTPGVPVFDVNYGAQSLLAGQTATPGGPWQAFTTSFIAGSASGPLSILSNVPNGLDGTLALDSMLVFGQTSDHVNILNPSFESGSGYEFPGYQGQIAGWTLNGPGGGGFNYAGNDPFAPTGVVPDGSNVAFLQNSASMAQTLAGLVPGQQYLLELDYNSRAGYPQGHMRVNLGGTNLFDGMFDAVGEADAYHRLSVPWTAGGETALLEIVALQNGADSAIAFDNISLRAIPEPTAAATALLGLGLAALRRRRA